MREEVRGHPQNHRQFYKTLQLRIVGVVYSIVLHSDPKWPLLLRFQTSTRPARHSKFSVSLIYLYLAAFLVLLSTGLNFVLKLKNR